MLIAAHEKKQHPEYQEYVENFEATLTGLEAGLRGGVRTPGRWCRYSAGHGALIPVSWCTPSAGDGAPVPPSKVHGGRRRWCTAAMLGLSL